MRPGGYRWISITAPADAREGFYPDTGCGTGAMFGAGAFGSGRNLIYDDPPQGIAAPENQGIGHTIEGNSSSCVGLHAYNFTEKPQLRELWVNLYFIDPAEITQRTGAVAMVGGLGLNLAPGQKRELSYSGRFSAAGRLIQLGGERHAWTPRFMAFLNDQLIYDSHDWKDAVVFNYDSITMNPPIDGIRDGAVSGILPFQANDVLRYSCFIENESDQVLTFRNEVEGGEMCNLWGTTVGGSVSGSFP
jgi:hypothetical protein